MRTVQAQAYYDNGSWCVYTDAGTFSRALSVNGARNAARKDAELALDGEPFELDFRVVRWFDPTWTPSADHSPRRSRRRAAIGELAREAEKGDPAAIDAFLRER